MPIKGLGTGRPIVDMCLACACARECIYYIVNCVFQDVLLVCKFLISLFTTISVKQWRSSIGCFYPRIVDCKCVNDENLCEILKIM